MTRDEIDKRIGAIQSQISDLLNAEPLVKCGVVLLSFDGVDEDGRPIDFLGFCTAGDQGKVEPLVAWGYGYSATYRMRHLDFMKATGAKGR